MEILLYRPAEGYIPKLGNKSQHNLSSCDPDIIRVVHAVIGLGYDISVTCGHRPKEIQHDKFLQGTSKVDWPHSKHNSMPSLAVDIAPYFSRHDKRNSFTGIPWEPKDHPDYLRPWFVLNGVMTATAKSMGIDLDWGGFWLTLKDYPHYQKGQR